MQWQFKKHIDSWITDDNTLFVQAVEIDILMPQFSKSRTPDDVTVLQPYHAMNLLSRDNP